ncbi:proline--tRNA ligase [Mycoplasmopsis synoviae]|uniref:proline--tRNA ligase n=1 Tax=Mycoplasmopsis synoviae TaxID=2109 RepID=UPI001CE1F69F|nr:proline--tRNA ligase [Mycoplasmopsis synoviae]UBX97448.1 proline--tRNA ligase [Mycoplasmopsis synoviae]UBX98133.1 proline--tRNA ligase [Mycoplasmopsis synoviae]UBX98489.1 proline--tRNA ligase [Mycoplasmopsis synoviae]UBX99167.1 proline--tRNA ligase [Mycoplasmopsis synoviae]UBY00108.1 proline--tRNA ligase [Mycoplasmopsis synoviae]
MKQLEKITPLEKDFAQWYTDVVTNGNLMNYGPAKGTIIYKPNSYGIWENIQKTLNEVFKKHGVENIYAPLFIPESLFKIEKEHVQGFNPELATVTQVGNKKLSEKLIVRPTSEVIFANLFKEDINSYNDLPKIYNQWANVVRWEKVTKPFLRTREFLWQEGHTSHSSAEEARNFTVKMIKEYEKFLKNYLAIPVVSGKKTCNEKFAGAVSTYTVEAMMKDGKALQAGTSHYLGQKFSRPYGISFKNKNNEEDFVYQTSWGVSTRLLGAIIMVHGDNRGVIIPPKIAPIKVDILEILADKNPEVSKVANKIYKELSKKLLVRLDASNKSPGFKASQSEIEGVPLRIEVGPRDLENNCVTFVRRDTLEKTKVDLENVKKEVNNYLKLIQNNLYQAAKQRLEENTVYAYNYEDFKKHIADNKFVVVPFCCVTKKEIEIKEETGATPRCILKKVKPRGVRLECVCKSDGCCDDDKAIKYVVFARAY